MWAELEAMKNLAMSLRRYSNTAPRHLAYHWRPGAAIAAAAVEERLSRQCGAPGVPEYLGGVPGVTAVVVHLCCSWRGLSPKGGCCDIDPRSGRRWECQGRPKIAASQPIPADRDVAAAAVTGCRKAIPVWCP